MSIQNPPDEEIPRTPPEETPDHPPIDTPQEPEQRAPGADQPPIGAPTDEPDVTL
jgi:hypothetical protein